MLIEQMIKFQNYQPIEKGGFYREVKALNIIEPLEALQLGMIKSL